MKPRLPALSLLLSLTLLVCTLLHSVALADTPTPVSLRLLGHVGGANVAVVTDGSYAYVATGLRVLVVDVKDPLWPALIGQTPVLPDAPRHLELQDNRLYVPVESGLLIFDVSEPSIIHQVGFWPQTSPYDPVYDVKVVGEYAFVGSGMGLRVLQVSDPTAPVTVGWAPGVVGSQLALARGSLGPLYAIDVWQLRVIDISNPRQPVELGQTQLDEPATSLAASAGAVYVGEGTEGLAAFDVTDPTAPKQVATRNPGGYVTGLAVADNSLYATVSQLGLMQYDVTDPANPIEQAEVRGPSFATSVAAWPWMSTRVIVSGENQGIVVLQRLGEDVFKILGQLDLPGVCYNPAVTGHYVACVGQFLGGVRVFDVSNAAVPRQIAAGLLGSDVSVVAASGKRIYAADGANWELVTYEINDAGVLAWLGATSLAWPPGAMQARGNLVYMLDPYGLQIIDTTDPRFGIRIGSYSISNSYGFALAGDRAYIYTPDSASIIDISDPADPHWIPDATLPGPISRLTAAGDNVFVADTTSVKVYDAVDPKSPFLVGSTPLGSQTYELNDMAFSDGYLYVSHLTAGVLVYRVDKSKAPVLIAQARRPDAAGIAVGSGKLFVAHFEGLMIYPAGPEKTFTPLVTR